MAGSDGQHLKPYWFKPGQCGNPKGRPPTRTMRERLKSLIAADAKSFPFVKQYLKALQVTDEEINEMDNGDVLMLTAFFKAARGSSPHLVELLDRLDGRVPQVVQQEGRITNGEIVELLKTTLADAKGDPDAAVKAFEQKLGESSQQVKVTVDIHSV